MNQDKILMHSKVNVTLRIYTCQKKLKYENMKH